MLVRELMTEDVVTVPREATVRTAVRTMLDEQIGSVIVLDEGVPVGIFTATDALLARYDCEYPFSEIQVPEGMTEDLITGSPEQTVREGARQLTEAGIEKLPISEDMELVGILTLNDIGREHATLLKEAYGLDVRKRQWTFEDTDD